MKPRRRLSVPARSFAVKREFSNRSGVWLSVSARPVRDDHGAIQGGVIVIRDITRRRHAEETSVKNERWVRSIIEMAHDAFIGIDADSVITIWNSRAETMFGWSREEAIAILLVEDSPRDAELTREALHEVI